MRSVALSNIRGEQSPPVLLYCYTVIIQLCIHARPEKLFGRRPLSPGHCSERCLNMLLSVQPQTLTFRAPAAFHPSFSCISVSDYKNVTNQKTPDRCRNLERLKIAPPAVSLLYVHVPSFVPLSFSHARPRRNVLGSINRTP